MAFSDSRVNSSLMGQMSRPPSVLGGIDINKKFSNAGKTNPLEQSIAGYKGAASTLGGMQQSGSYTSTTETEKTVSGAAISGAKGLAAGISLAGKGAAVASEFAAGGISSALMAVGPIGWALAAVSLGAYLFS